LLRCGELRRVLGIRNDGVAPGDGLPRVIGEGRSQLIDTLDQRVGFLQEIAELRAAASHREQFRDEPEYAGGFRMKDGGARCGRGGGRGVAHGIGRRWVRGIALRPRNGTFQVVDLSEQSASGSSAAGEIRKIADGGLNLLRQIKFGLELAPLRRQRCPGTSGSLRNLGIETLDAILQHADTAGGLRRSR
jgi:hypothetical protein